MIEQLQYHSLEELEALSLQDLQALWELVPTDRQKAYRTAYDREVRNAGAIGSDELEGRVAAELQKRYQEAALVPVGTRWARTPQRVQDTARENALPDTGLDADKPASGKPNPRMIAILGVMILIFVGFIGFRLLVNGGNEVALSVTPEPSLTPTPEVSPIPTPLALEAQDEVITGGDSERTVAYPVNLQVLLPGESRNPRVWVVQRRAVEAAEWNYDANPDIASFVNGMSVRPVIGIPWSEDNAALFESIEEGTVFNLTMNTGAVLRYEFASKAAVLRSDTRIFRQVGPGLVLLLIGETDDNGLPTGTRTLISATYPAEQELSRLDELVALNTTPTTPEPTMTLQPTSTPVPFAGIDVQLIDVTTLEGQLTTRIRIYNGGTTTATFTQDDIWLAPGYVENPSGPRTPAEGLAPFTLLPEQAVDLTLVWYWNGEPYASLQVGGYHFAIILFT